MKARTFGNMAVVIDNGQGVDLRARHFRGRRVRKAGNFFRWDNPAEFIGSFLFRKLIAPRIEELPVGQIRHIEVETDMCIGWTGMISRHDWIQTTDTFFWDRIPPEDRDMDMLPQSFEWRQIRKGLKGEFVTDGSPAPITTKLTIVVRVVERDYGKLAIIYAVRPGLALPTDMIAIRRGHVEIPEEYELMFWNWDADGDDPDDPIYNYGEMLAP